MMSYWSICPLFIRHIQTVQIKTDRPFLSIPDEIIFNVITILNKSLRSYESVVNLFQKSSGFAYLLSLNRDANSKREVLNLSRSFSLLWTSF